MKRVLQIVIMLCTGVASFACNDPQTSPNAPQSPSYTVERAHGRSAFGFNGTIVGPTGTIVRLSGGGSFDPSSASNVIPAATDGHGNGGFRCEADIAVGPLAGCEAGEGTHWDTAQLLESSAFKCGGIANEQAKTATTSANVIVVLADFYRAGDGNRASFQAKMFLSDADLAPDIPGVQNIWIQGVGCGTGVVTFND